jgi:hypothetical protein
MNKYLNKQILEYQLDPTDSSAAGESGSALMMAVRLNQ